MNDRPEGTRDSCVVDGEKGRFFKSRDEKNYELGANFASPKDEYSTRITQTFVRNKSTTGLLHHDLGGH